jgi:hypothetical protein
VLLGQIFLIPDEIYKVIITIIMVIIIRTHNNKRIEKNNTEKYSTISALYYLGRLQFLEHNALLKQIRIRVI